MQAAWLAAGMAIALSAILGALTHRCIGRPTERLHDAIHAQPIQTPHHDKDREPPRELHDRLQLILDQAQARSAMFESLLRSKDESVSGMVHELRTPLTTIAASLEMIQEGYASEPEELDSFIEQASLAAWHMSFLINDVLDSAAIDAGRLRMDIDDWPLVEILDQISKTMHPLAAMRSIAIRTSHESRSVAVRGDRGRILQVVFNLVSNAVKYSNEGSTVEIRSSETPMGAIVEVVDEGIGVPLEARKHLFSKFHRPHTAEDSTATGTGIGLYLAKFVVERMGGSIGYENREDTQGSIFWVTLPLAQNKVVESEAVG